MALVLGLVALALVDSTSIGTLVIPVWLLLSPRRPAPARVLLFLGAIAAFYLAVGLALVLLLRSGLDVLPQAREHPAVLWGQLLIGVGLFALCWRYDSGRRRRRGQPDRTARWRDRVLAGDPGRRALVRLAVTAGALELLTMLPYLAAVGLLVAADLTAAQSLLALTGYCAVMVLPAAVLTGLRSALQDRLERPLERLDRFVSRHADSALGWVMGIAGFLTARDAAAQLWAPGLL